jgi:predicted RNA-binding Zn-ribbon protein involved in translation (DUF1610 family)
MAIVHFYCVLCGTALQTSAESPPNLMQCDCCLRYVPVPRLLDGLGEDAGYPPAFPPEVLELSVKFLCTGCGAKIRTDARHEGREASCPKCGAQIRIPRWSTVPAWLSFASGSEEARTPPAHLPTRTQAPALSAEEIDFLRGAEPRKPGAVS